MRDVPRCCFGTTRILFAAAVVIAISLQTQRAPAATFNVDSVLDATDASPNDGLCRTLSNTCTLRAAIQQANASPGIDTINIPAGTYALTISGRGLDTSVGDLNVSDSVNIVGAGAGTTIIDAGAIADRVFEFTPGPASSHVSGLTIQHGALSNLPGGQNECVNGNVDYWNLGGGILNWAELSLTDVVVRGNSTDATCPFSGGGGIQNLGTLTLERCTVTSNSTTQAGGGISNQATLTIIDSVISGNTAPGLGGGGVMDNSYTPMTITGSTISGNAATNPQACAKGGAGGGILSTGATITNSTISGNHATCQGGGVWVNANAPTMFRNVTIFDNVIENGAGSAGGGGGLWDFGSSTLSNTIIAGNLDHTNKAPDCYATTSYPIQSDGYNLIQDTTNCALGGDQTGNLLGIDPQLGPLADNGGPTPTHVPLPSSFVIEGGNPSPPGNEPACLLTDQRGVGRPVGARCDIGAVEATVCGDHIVSAPVEECDRGPSGDACCSSSCHILEPDTDGDGLCDPEDPCPTDPTPDLDGDGFCGNDNCPNDFNPDQRNSDGAGENPLKGDVCDVCPTSQTNSCDSAKTSKGTIDTNGGTIASADGSVSIAIPPGAVNGPTSVSITGFNPTSPGTGNKHCIGGSNDGALCTNGTECPSGICEHNYGLGTNSAVFVADLQPEKICQAGPNGGRGCSIDSECPGGSCVPFIFNGPVTLTFGWPDANDDGGVDNTGISEANLKIFRNGAQLAGPCKSDPNCDQTANRWTIQVTQFSEYALTLECGLIPDAKLKLSHLGVPGDGKLSFKGVGYPVQPLSNINPRLNGADITIDDTNGPVLHVTLQPGDWNTTIGWKEKQTAQGTKWTYADKSGSPPGGITKALVQDLGGAIKVAFVGKKTTYQAPSPQGVRVELNLPGAGLCVDEAFDGSPAGGCVLNRSGSTLKCE